MGKRRPWLLAALGGAVGEHALGVGSDGLLIVPGWPRAASRWRLGLVPQGCWHYGRGNSGRMWKGLVCKIPLSCWGGGGASARAPTVARAKTAVSVVVMCMRLSGWWRGFISAALLGTASAALDRTKVRAWIGMHAAGDGVASPVQRLPRGQASERPAPTALVVGRPKGTAREAREVGDAAGGLADRT